MTKEEIMAKFPVGSKIVDDCQEKGTIVYHGTQEIVIEFDSFFIIGVKYTSLYTQRLELSPREYWIPWNKIDIASFWAVSNTKEECEKVIKSLHEPENWIPMQIFPPEDK